ncbi:MAG: gamma-glutamyltransferase, partial [Acidimicrobiales bacterium]
MVADLDTTRSAHHMVCTVDERATGAAVEILARGGNAVDAAVAANTVLTVVAPHMCGMGGDLFAIIHDGRGLPKVLNASGRAGSGASAAAVRAEGHDRIPNRHHIAAVTLPGCVDGWVAMHARFGHLPLTDLVADAVSL